MKKPISKKEDFFVNLASETLKNKKKKELSNVNRDDSGDNEDNETLEQITETSNNKTKKEMSKVNNDDNESLEQMSDPVLIVDKTNDDFDEDDFLSSIITKRKTDIITNSITKPVLEKKSNKKDKDKGEDENEEFTIIPKKNTKIKKIKKKLDVPSFIIEEDNDGDETEIPVINFSKPDEIAIEIINPKTPKRRYTTKETGVVEFGTAPLVQIGDDPIDDRILPKTDPPIDIKVSSYFQNNREIFVNFINDLFKPYKQNLLKDVKEISCDDLGSSSEEMTLLTHQKIVRDYMNLYTPYRGVLLYHGLGSGKTCSSIAIAEGFQSTKQVIIMTPAYLRMNYIQEIKKCGNPLFRKNQFWEWIDLNSNPDYLNTLSSVLGLPREYIRKNQGAWLVNFSKSSNFEELTNDEKNVIDSQLDEMIQNKYKFINYNGLTTKKFKTMTNNYKKNIFDNSIIIIDEAHNLISRIVNKINKMSSTGKTNKIPDILSLKIYELLLAANNSRIVLLTGTPLVNFPNEIGILFNILRGYIKTWKFTLTPEIGNKLDTAYLQNIFLRERTHDYIEYLASTKTLTVTRNPFGFESKVTANSGYKGVYKKEGDDITDKEFIDKIIKILKSNNIKAVELGSEFKVYKALPDNLEDFVAEFINEETGNVKNIDKFKRRIIGLPSYFRSAQEELLPDYDKIKDFNVIKIPMSDYQFRVYESARQEERLSEKPSSKKKKVDPNGLFIEASSTYRIFSRLFCNYVMPQPPGRPTPKSMKLALILKQFGSLYNTSQKNEILERLEEKKVIRLNQKEGRGGGNYEDVDENLDNIKITQIGGLNDEERDKIEYAIVDLAIMFPALTMSQILDYLHKHSSKKSLDEIAIGLQEMQNITDPTDNQNTDDEILENYEEETEDIINDKKDATYSKALQDALTYLKENGDKYLSPEGLDTYGRKMLAILENISSTENTGLHLVYSQFRTMEGLGILMLVLQYNGFSQFKIKRVGNSWDINFPEETLGKPMFALYTGTEENEEREIIRNIFNGDWNDLPISIKEKILKVSQNNNLGEIIKVLMITQAGSEGINLKNTRFVHLMEPYWHPVRTEQVVGRARRICSHKNLPKELQNVKVFLYLMTLTPEQLKSEIAVELRTKDLSKRAPYVALTSDEKLFEISNIKEELSSQLLKAIKEASIDCSLHIKSSAKEKLSCLTFGKPSIDYFSYKPSYLQEQNDNISKLNKTKITWRGKELTFNGKKMILKESTKEVFDYDSYIQALETPEMVPILIGLLEKNKDGKYTLRNV